MSVTDVIWVLPALAGVALGFLLRPKWVPLLLGLVLVTASVVLFGYSLATYSSNDCQQGEPCPAGEQVIRVVEPVALLVGAPLFLAAFGRVAVENAPGRPVPHSSLPGAFVVEWRQPAVLRRRAELDLRFSRDDSAQPVRRNSKISRSGRFVVRIAVIVPRALS